MDMTAWVFGVFFFHFVTVVGFIFLLSPQGLYMKSLESTFHFTKRAVIIMVLESKE